MGENLTKPQLWISQPICMIDRPISIKAFHLPPGEQATIRVQRQAATPSQLFHFESYAIFQADHEGVIDLETAAPIGGTYSYIDGMGLFYTQELKKTELLLNESYSKLAPQQMVLSLELSNGQVVDKKEITRLWKAPDIMRQDVRDQGLVGTFFTHQDKVPRPGIIVIGGSEGGIYEYPAALLASHGFHVLALGYWGVEHLPEQLVEIPLEYMQAAITWMKNCELIEEGSLGIHFTSKGGELALLAASRFPEITAVVSLHGSSVSMSGIVPWSTDNYLPPSWTHEGKAVPYARPTNSPEVAMECLLLRKLGENPLKIWYEFLLSDQAIRDEATIPLEKINGPILMISGDADAIYDSVATNEPGLNRLKDAHFSFPYKHIVYPGAGHEAGVPYINLATNKFTGGNKRDTARASIDSWTKTIEFFKEHSSNCILKSEPTFR